MKLSGYLNYSRYGNFILIIRQTKNYNEYILASSYTERDRLNVLMGRELKDKVITFDDMRDGALTIDYIVGALKLSVLSKECSGYKDISLIKIILEDLAYVRSYRFSKSDLMLEDTDYSTGDAIYHYMGNSVSDGIEIDMVTEGRYLKSLRYNMSGKECILYPEDSSRYIKIPKAVKYTPMELEDIQRDTLNVVSINPLNFEELSRVYDLSWYVDEETGEVKKDYRAIHNPEELQKYVLNKLDEKVKECRENSKPFPLRANWSDGVKWFDLFVDTETTGLNIFNLHKDNPDKDVMTAMSLSWEDNQGVVIFFRMKHFENIDVKYTLEKLRPYLETHRHPLIIQDVKHDYPELKANGFLDSYEPQSGDYPGLYIKRGLHNSMFDHKVFYDENLSLTIDYDTLQESFLLNPTVTKGGKKLKRLTRVMFGHETLELDVILGKNNEGNFHLITDELVAIIYACSDTDYARMLKYKLDALLVEATNLVGKDLFKEYNETDMPLLHILAESEYYGYRMDIENTKKSYDILKADLEMLEECIYSYVGTFVERRSRKQLLDTQLSYGTISQEEYQKGIKELEHVNKQLRFKIKGDELNSILYTTLGYPVLKRTDKGKASTDKFVLKKFASKKLDKPINSLAKDIISTADIGKPADQVKPLVSAKEFNSCKYPLAILLQTYGDLYKQYTSFIGPIVEQNMESVLFKGISASNIDTSRISCPTQTLKKKLKVNAIASGDDWYLCVFDFSQIEYRTMPAMAHDQVVIDQLNDKYADYHRIVGGLLHNKAPHEVTGSERSGLKSVNFGIPYGLGLYSLCQNIFGKVTEDNLVETRLILAKWKKANGKTWNYLESVRDEALIQVPLSDDYLRFLNPKITDTSTEDLLSMESASFGEFVKRPDDDFPRRYGMVKMDTGRFKLFNLDKEEPHRIRRQSGNYPIQGLAAWVFKRAIIGFRERCIKEGIGDKVIINMYVHDELSISIHKSVHPYLIYKIILEECMLHIPGHPIYYCGVAMCNNWYQGKSDDYEAPVEFVEECAKKWDDGLCTETFDKPSDVVDFIKKEKDKFLLKLYYNYTVGLQPIVEKGKLNFKTLLPKFINYYLKPNAYAFFGSYRDVRKDVKDDDFMASLEKIILDYTQKDLLVMYPDERKVRYRYEDRLVWSSDSNPFTDSLFEDLTFTDEEPEDDGYWNFDDLDTFSSDVTFSYSDFEEDEGPVADETLMDGKHSLTEIYGLDKREKYKNINYFGSTLIAKCSLNKKAIRASVTWLQDNQSDKGTKVMLKAAGTTKTFIIGDADFKELDVILGGVN